MTFPTHIVAKAGGRSFCGMKDPIPVVLVEFVTAHVLGHQMVLCAECLAVAEGVTA